MWKGERPRPSTEVGVRRGRWMYSEVTRIKIYSSVSNLSTHIPQCPGTNQCGERKTSHVGSNHHSLSTLIPAPGLFRHISTPCWGSCSQDAATSGGHADNHKVRHYFLHVQGQGIVVVWLAAAIKLLDKVIFIPRECIVHSLGGWGGLRSSIVRAAFCFPDHILSLTTWVGRLCMHPRASLKRPWTPFIS